MVSREVPIWDEPAVEALKEMESSVRPNFAGEAPDFNLSAAQWAAEIIYYACQALVCRDIARETVQERLALLTHLAQRYRCFAQVPRGL